MALGSLFRWLNDWVCLSSNIPSKKVGGGGCKKLKHVICSAFLRVIILIFEYFL